MRCTNPTLVIADTFDVTNNGKKRILFTGWPDYISKYDSAFISMFYKNNNLLPTAYQRAENINNKFQSLNRYEAYCIPCNKCAGCRSNWSREWSIRAFHESLLHSRNCFITLTYNEQHLPDIYNENSSRSPKADFQRFMKLFRKNLNVDFSTQVRYFHVFEYGTKFNRPHHHAIIFGTDLPDRTLHQIKGGFPVFRSKLLERSWECFPYGTKSDGESLGFSTVQNVSFEVCAYVARYCMKKVAVDAEYYDGRQPEFNLMSRRPGLGHDWITQHFNDVYNNDEVIMKSRLKFFRSKPPKYYDTQYDLINSVRMEVLKNARKEYAKTHSCPDSFKRLKEIEKYQLEKINRMKRDYERNDV